MLLLLASLAWSGVAEDLLVAADGNQPDSARKAAFARMSAEDATGRVIALADDPQTTNDERWVLLRSLGSNPTVEARDALVRYLGDKNALTRMAALQALADRKDPTLSGRIAARLEDPAILVRYAAIDALGRLGDPAALPDLARALEDPTNRYRGTSLWVRRKAAEAIGAIGTDAAVPHLAKALDDDDPEVVVAAMRGLERVAGFSYSEGRTSAEELAAWRRWAGGR